MSINRKRDGPPGLCSVCGKRTVEGYWRGPKLGRWVRLCFTCMYAMRLSANRARCSEFRGRPRLKARAEGFITINDEGELCRILDIENGNGFLKEVDESY